MLILYKQQIQIKTKVEMLGMFRLEIMLMIGMPEILVVHGVQQLQMITLVDSKTILEEVVEEVEHVSSVMKKATYQEIALKVVEEVVLALSVMKKAMCLEIALKVVMDQEDQEFASSVEMHHTWLESVLNQMKSI